MAEGTWSEALAAEMACASLPDPRLARRLGMMVQRLADKPDASFPSLFASAELEAAYRFFGNASVTADGILSGHFEATRDRCRREPGVIVVHDSTTLNFRAAGQRRGLGRLVTSGQAFFAHVSLAIPDDGSRRPLGVLALKTWTRTERSTRNERDRWGEQVHGVAERLGAQQGLVHVMDREADDFALLADLVGGSHRFVVRSMHDRGLSVSQPSDPRKLDEVVAQIERIVERDAALSKRIGGTRSPVQKRIHPPRAARTAGLAVGATRVLLQRPRSQPRTLPESLAVNVVRVWEPSPPEGEPPVEWVLLTTEPIATAADIVRIVDTYRARWTIEEYFKALKTGCAYEARQLEDYEGLVNALAVFAPIACQLLLLRSEARRVPDAPAAGVIADDELEVLRAIGRKPLPPTPTARDVLLAVAALGGHIKYAGEPGWLTIVRGYTELRSLTRGWNAAKLQLRRDQR